MTHDDGQTTETTRPLQSIILAEDFKLELEELPNIRQVTIVRSKSLVGYEWCSEKMALKFAMITHKISLAGCAADLN